MSPLVIIVGSTFIIVALVTLVLLSLLLEKKNVIEIRLEELRAAAQGEAEAIDISKRQGPGWQKTASALSEMAPVTAGQKFKYRRMLMYAGFRSEGAVSIFIGTKVALGAALFAALFLYTLSLRHNPALAVALGSASCIVGLLIPNVWLGEKIKKRKTQIFHTLPDVLDLLTVCVEAGLGLDAALIKITEEKQLRKQVLAAEIRTVSREIRAGKPRIDALRDLGERTGVDDIKSLVGLLIQTEKLGASLSRSLRVHSDSLRTKRRQIAEEAAAKTSVKMIFPLAFFIFPALMVVLLGPAVIRIFDSLLGTVK